MSKDTVKTVAGIVVIGLIVVATFLYGNSQRQAQLNHDQQLKQQAGSQATASTQATVAPSSNPGTSNTSPVKSPAANSIQGSHPATTTPAPQVAGAATVPVTGGTGNGLPETGPASFGFAGIAAMLFMIMAVRHSRRRVLAAERVRR